MLQAAVALGAVPLAGCEGSPPAPAARPEPPPSCAQLLKRLTGSIGTWFRPSQTQHATALIQAQATRVGYPTCLSYDLDSLDYTDPAPAAVVSTVAKSVQNGSIVSLHFGHATTVT